jgi:Lrp/AsnC family transcriptional regulator for asnA, asnC and gidA
MYEIDNIDREIINLLVEDGRMTASEIARRVGEISERSVRYRIDRMREEGAMKISAIPNPKALGFNVVAEVWLEVDTSHVMEIAQEIARHECVSYVATSIGERDVSIQVIARSNEEVYSIVTEKFGKMPGVRKTNTSIVPVILKDIFDWRVPITKSAVTHKKSSSDADN